MEMLKDIFYDIIIKSLDPLRAKKTFIRKKLGHTAVSAVYLSVVFSCLFVSCLLYSCHDVCTV